MSFGIFLLRQHVASAIPDELLEAARVDGASEWWILARVIAPLSVPALSAVGIFAFIQAWAAFIWPLLVANDQRLFNMEVGLTAFQFRFSVDYGKLMAGLGRQRAADAGRLPDPAAARSSTAWR